jgi:sulfite reductase (NADPH) flavoprotein alpha-component
MISFPDNAPLGDDQKKQLSSVIAGLSSEQRAWVSGYLAGSNSQAQEKAPATTSASQPVTVLYGTESGNSEALAGQLAKQAKQKGYKPQLLNMSDATLANVKDAQRLLVVVSTWGDGEPPESSEAFYNELMEADIALNGVEFSVCALGDTSYDLFCQTGKDLDARLEKLGAKRLVDRVDCDLEFDEPFSNWSQSIWSELGAAEVVAAPSSLSQTQAPVFNKKNPFPAEVIENQLLSGSRSAKETYHVELSLEGSGFDYQPGDVLGVIPRNSEDIVEAFINVAGLDGNTEIKHHVIGQMPLAKALTTELDITGLSRKVAASWQQICGSEKLAELLAPDAKEKFKEWSFGRQIIDLLESYPAKALEAQQLVDILRKLPVRLYSIASSFNAHPGEVHLTVAAVRYNTHDKNRKGVASTFLADDAPKGAKVSVYTHHNKNFRLPENNETPIIMVGPGTGIAPFRAFIEERSAAQAAGESWLFFGDQHYNEDFLYQLEWQDQLKNGALSRIDVAFSRDQPEKVYVQHKLAEHANDIWQWLQKGAHFYVCGDATYMAKDVHQTLLEIVASKGEMSSEEAEAYVAALKKDKRYQRDVY